MNDRPTARELIDAVRGFLEKELLPALTDARLKFQTLVAANVLSIATRELSTEEKALREEWELLGAESTPPQTLDGWRQQVRELNEKWCLAIRAGDHDAPHKQAALRERLRGVVVEKLLVANPRYLEAITSR